MSKTVADILIERLIEWKVNTIFALPGDGINGIYEVLRIHEKKIKVVQVRHEEAAAFAACAYAKYSGRLGVCLATSGPGGCSTGSPPARTRKGPTSAQPSRSRAHSIRAWAARRGARTAWSGCHRANCAPRRRRSA